MIEWVDGEMLVYDKTSNVASQLDETSAWVMRNCDGTRTVSDLVTGLTTELDQAADEDVVLLALDRLLDAGLIESGYERRDDSATALSRRRFFHRAGIAGVGAVTVPAVFSMVVPSAAAAGSGPGGGSHPVPTVETGAAIGIGPTSVTLTGTVDGHNEETTYFFQYGTTADYSSARQAHVSGDPSTAPQQELNPEPVSVSVVVTGLVPDTTYHFRLVADDAGGPAYGEDATFRTAASKPARPKVVTEHATAVGSSSAMLHGSIDGFGVRTGYRFEYGKSKRYGARTPLRRESSSSARTVSAKVTRLAPGTTYHFRLVAEGDHPVFGADKTFKTKVIKPIERVNIPQLAGAGTDVAVTVRLRTRATVTIALLSRGRVLEQATLRSRTGSVAHAVQAPNQDGDYVIRIHAVGGGTKQTVEFKLVIY